jgi:hypothetical protein
MTDTIIEIPGVGRVAFPSSMSDTDIESAIKTKILPSADPEAQRIAAAKDRGQAQGKAPGVLPYIDNLVRQAANGVTFGYADEIASALDSMLGRKGSYSENLAENRAQDKAFSAENPIAAGAANIAGNVGSAALAMPAKLTAMGPSLVGNMAKYGTTGAVLGGIQGFGEGEGGFGDRAEHAVPATVFGAVGGAAVPVVGAGARRIAETPVGEWIGQKVVAPAASYIGELLGRGVPAKSLSAAAPDGAAGGQSIFTNIAEAANNPTERGAIDRLATALQRSGSSADQVRARLDRLGPEAMLADADNQFLREARRANTLPGETSSYAKGVLEARDRQAGNRIVSTFEGTEPPLSSYELGKEFDANIRAVGQRAYQGDMVDAGLKQTPELMALYENPYVAKALDHVMSVERNARVGRPEAVPSSPVEIMHKVKQAIWDMGFDGAIAKPGANASYYRDLGTDFVNKLKAANPALAEADAAYSQAKSLPEYFDQGRALLARGSGEKATDASAPALADLLMNANPQQVLAARSGATNAVRETALEGTRPARALAQRIDESAPVQSKLTELYGPERAQQIINRAATERTFADTSNELLRGSKTADKLAEALDTGNAGFRVTPSGVQPRFFERLADLPELLMKPNEGVRNQIGRMTLNANPDETRRILAQAEQLLRARQTAKPVRAAIGAGAAESIVRD